MKPLGCDWLPVVSCLGLVASEYSCSKMLEVVWKRRFDWLIVEQGDGDQRQWGLGCRTCRKLHEQRQIVPNATRAAAVLKDSVFIHCRVGQKGKLQVCTFVNHTTRECHSEAVRAELEQANPRPAELEETAEPMDSVGPTPALIRLALEVSATGALGAQAAEFARKAELAGRKDSANYPPTYAKPYMHFRLVNCLAKTL